MTEKSAALVPATRPIVAFGVDRRDANGMTRLMEAARHADTVMKIPGYVKGGADINAIDYAGNNALMHTLEAKQDGGAVALLLNLGIKPDHVRYDGATALMLAAMEQNPEAIQRLLQANVPLDNQHKKTGDTALIWALRLSDGWAACKLVDAGADFEKLKNAQGDNALDMARRHLRGKDRACFEDAVTGQREKAAEAARQQAVHRQSELEQNVSDATVLKRDVTPLKPVALRRKPR